MAPASPIAVEEVMKYSETLISKIENDDLFSMSAALSYYTALSLAPLLILLITVVTTLDPRLQVDLFSQINRIAGDQTASVMIMIIESAKKSPDLKSWAGFFGVLTLLFSASAIFGQLRDSLNRIFEIHKTDDNIDPRQSWPQLIWQFIRLKFLNIGLVFTFILSTFISLAMTSALSLYLKSYDTFNGNFNTQLLNFLITMTIFTFLFAGIYYFIPSRKIGGKLALTSGFLTAIMFSLGKSLIGLYLGTTAIASSYGAAGSMIILLMWVYYSSAIFFFCAEFTFHQFYTKVQKKEWSLQTTLK